MVAKDNLREELECGDLVNAGLCGEVWGKGASLFTLMGLVSVAPNVNHSESLTTRPCDYIHCPITIIDSRAIRVSIQQGSYDYTKSRGP